MDYYYTYLLYLCTFIYWGVFLLAWLVNYRILNREHTKPVHYILAFTLTQKLLTVGLLVLLSSESESSTYTQYLTLCLKSFESIFDTFLFSLALVLSHGLGLSRDSLDEVEMTRVTIMMGLMYIIFNLYYFNRSYFEAPIVLMLIIYWFISWKNFSINFETRRNFYQNLRLRGQFSNVRQESELFMTKLIRLLSNVLFLSKVTFHVLNGICWWYDLKVSKLGLTILLVCQEVIVLVWMTATCVIFWPRYRSESTLRNNSFYIGKIYPKKEELYGNTPAIIVLPLYKGLNPERPYDGINIAIPIETKARIPGTGQLNEPLLENHHEN
jgi:hypothetical protein